MGSYAVSDQLNVKTCLKTSPVSTNRKTGNTFFDLHHRRHNERCAVLTKTSVCTIGDIERHNLVKQHLSHTKSSNQSPSKLKEADSTKPERRLSAFAFNLIKRNYRRERPNVKIKFPTGTE
jgi:hypothetical protein